MRINNPHDHRDHTAIRLVERRPRPVALPVDQHRVPDARLRVVQGDEIPLRWSPGRVSGCTTSRRRFL